MAVAIFSTYGKTRIFCNRRIGSFFGSGHIWKKKRKYLVGLASFSQVIREKALGVLMKRITSEIVLHNFLWSNI